MKSELLAVRNVHHIEESQLDQMLSRHSDRAHDHVSFLVSPPCFATNFMGMAKFELASTADEAQGSTSRLAAGGKEIICGASEGCVGRNTPVSQRHDDGLICPEGALKTSPAGNSDFSILHRPHIVKSREEVHVELCHSCERMAAGNCECGNPVCSVHRYNAQGDREPNGGFCVMCSAVPQDSTEMFSNGRQV